MADKAGWHCTYTPPGQGRRPFTPDKLRDIVRLVCKEAGFPATIGACAGGLWDCADSGELVCDVVGGLANAADVVNRTMEDWDVVIETIVSLARGGGFMTIQAAVGIEAAVKVLSDPTIANFLRDALEWLDCGEFVTGGGYGGEDSQTGGGF